MNALGRLWRNAGAKSNRKVMIKFFVIQLSFLLACLLCGCSTEYRRGDFKVVEPYNFAVGNYVIRTPDFCVGTIATYRFRAIDLPNPVVPNRVHFHSRGKSHNLQWPKLSIIVLDLAGKPVAHADGRLKPQESIIDLNYREYNSQNEKILDIQHLPDSLRNYTLIVKVINPSASHEDTMVLKGSWHKGVSGVSE